jgi:TadE-like protein
VLARRFRHLRSHDGQALVEFALVVPLVLMLLLGIVDFGLGYKYKSDETSLANEAARFAVVNYCAPCSAAVPPETIEQYVKNDADGALRKGGGQIVAPGVQVSICFPNGGIGAVGDSLQATVRSEYQFLPSLLNFVPGLPTTIHLTSSATQRVQQAYDGSTYAAVACP